MKPGRNIRIGKKQYNKELAEAEKRIFKGHFYTEKEAERILEEVCSKRERKLA